MKRTRVIIAAALLLLLHPSCKMPECLDPLQVPCPDGTVPTDGICAELCVLKPWHNPPGNSCAWLDPAFICAANDAAADIDGELGVCKSADGASVCREDAL